MAENDFIKRMTKCISGMPDDQCDWLGNIAMKVKAMKSQKEMMDYLETKSPAPQCFMANLGRA